MEPAVFAGGYASIAAPHLPDTLPPLLLGFDGQDFLLSSFIQPCYGGCLGHFHLALVHHLLQLLDSVVQNLPGTFDTSLAVSRIIYDGFLDRFPNLKIIAAHGGGALPFLIGRLDQCFDNIPACRTKVRERPSHYARRIWADTVVFTDDALAMAVRVFGSDRVMYGSDYPHTIGDPIGCLARVDRLPDGVRDRVRGGSAKRIFEFR